MKLNMWEAISQAAKAAPAALAIIAEAMGQQQRRIKNLMADKATLLEADERASRERADAILEAKRTAMRSLGDGWHNMSNGAEIFIDAGFIARAKATNPEQRASTARMLLDVFNVRLNDWNEKDEADVDDIPF